jgi:hypothetical protein
MIFENQGFESRIKIFRNYEEIKGFESKQNHNDLEN